METKEFKDMNMQERMTAFYQGFDKTVVILDAPEKAETKDIKVTYTGDIPLLGFKPGCGCQSFSLHDGVVSGSWNMSGGTENTYFEIIADDGVPLEVVQANGEIVPNPAKLKITINLKANVPVTEG